jgi:transcription elongation factor Elf1
MVAYRMPGEAPISLVHAPPPVVVCRCCGVVAPTHGTACAACKRPLADTRVQVPAQSLDTFWVAVRCGFTCNSCKFLAPLDALDADGAVECAHCGLRQRFEVPLWTPALEFAHAVGDLAGPQPEGRNPHPILWIGSENPYAGAGEQHAFEHTESGVLSIDAAPGHPVCRRCHVPVAATVTGPGAVETRCPTCNEHATFALTDEGRNLSAALLAGVADEHRKDRLRATATATVAGVIALTCPSCGGPLGVPDHGGIAICTFCKAACIVPARVRTRARNETPEPEVWWLLFQGASAKRRELEAPTDGAGPGAAAKAIGGMIKFGGDQTPIGDAPAVYDAPEVPGVYWPQVAVTAVVGTVAAALGMVIYEALLR